MNNKYFIILTLLIMLLIGNLYAQTSTYNISNINNNTTDKFDLVTDMCFMNLNTGYVTATWYNNVPNPAKYYNFLYKTTNSGINWTKLWSYEFPPISSTGKLAISMKNEIGYFIKQGSYKRVLRTSNGGANYMELDLEPNNPSYTFPNYLSEPVTSMNSLNDLFIIRKFKKEVVKIYLYIGHYYQYTYSLPQGVELYHVEVSHTNNIVYVCGRKLSYGQWKPFLAKLTPEHGALFTTILDFDGEHDTYSIGSLIHMSIINNGNGDIIKISGANKLIEYNTVSNNVSVLTSTWSEGRKITFSDANNGFYMNSDMTTDDPPLELGNSAIYRTTNNGQSWLPDFSSTTGSLSYPNRFYSCGNIAYFTCSVVSNNQAYFYSRNLSKSLATYHDNISSSGNIIINNQTPPFQTPSTINIRGGSMPLWTEPVLNQGQSEEEKIFYRWSFNEMINSIPSYDFFYDGELAAHYKTKQKADNAWAINNANQTKAIRDTNYLNNNPLNLIHQVHESIGGIFYTRSTNGGGNWSSEEVVNYNQYTNAAFGNRNPSITVKRMGVNPITISEPDKNVAVVWERYNHATGKTEILASERGRNIQNTDYEWKGYDDNTGSFIFTSFPSSSDFQSTPKIFVSSFLTTSNLYNSALVVPHLEKNGNNTKVIVSIKYQTHSYDLLVDEGDIKNLSVSSSYNYYGVFELHMVYQKDNSINNIVYKKIMAGWDLLTPSIQHAVLETVENLGSLDGMRARFTPDISVQNGLPVVTYCGNYYDNRIIQYEDETVSDNMMSLLNHTTITLFKTTNNGAWSEYVRFTGLNPQENPNVEGSKNAMAYLLSFRKNGSYFQYVKINGLSQYYCTPESYSGTDAKFVRGSYIGQFGSNYNPLLLTLSNPDANSRYTIGQRPFSISNIASSDGFNNLEATIERDNTTYSLTLGPIIASNTTYGFEDDTPPQTVHNPVEFNETMISAVFSLSDNDTLLIGANGKYTTADSEFQPLKYHVDLVNASTMEIHRELFRDTINIEDSVGIEFLRGYIINNISNGTDQFYVQMVVDSVDAEDGDYGMTGEYADDTPPEGDAPMNYKTKIFFENSSNSLSSGNQIPKNYELAQNYPNPFNPVTKISFALPTQGFVSLKIYDITGREIKTLVNEIKQAGYYTVNFNSSNLSSGVYFYRIQSGDFVQTKRMVILK